MAFWGVLTSLYTKTLFCRFPKRVYMYYPLHRKLKFSSLSNYPCISVVVRDLTFSDFYTVFYVFLRFTDSVYPFGIFKLFLNLFLSSLCMEYLRVDVRNQYIHISRTRNEKQTIIIINALLLVYIIWFQTSEIIIFKFIKLFSHRHLSLKCLNVCMYVCVRDIDCSPLSTILFQQCVFFFKLFSSTVLYVWSPGFNIILKQERFENTKKVVYHKKGKKDRQYNDQWINYKEANCARQGHVLLLSNDTNII